ncbi:MAG: hypothetical protein HPY53_01790 [Brevinematales bacterium]|nr:hypothetical protein [Brevinematales bacterium]
MRKFLLFAVLGLVLVAGQVHADGTRALSIGSPIALVDDTSFINTFPSRLQSFPSAVFFGAMSSTIVTMFPGIALRLSDAFAMMYIYDQPDGLYGGTIPAALNARTGVALGTAMHSPLNLWYGMKMGGLQIGIFYRLSYYSTTSAEGFNTNTGVVDAKDYGTYYLHTITPGLTIMMDDKGSALDLAVNVGLQSLNNMAENAGTTNIVYAPGIKLLGATAQLTMQLVPEFRLAFRLNASHQNNNYVDYNVLAGSNTTNANILNHVNTIGLTAGFKYQIIPALGIYFDLIGQLSQTYNGATIADTLTLPPSNNFGAEWVIDAWAFRVGMNTRYSLTTVSTIVDGRISGKTYANAISYTPYLGIGYKALPWAINFIIDPQIFTKTILIISSAASYTPIVRFQLNYVF